MVFGYGVSSLWYLPTDPKRFMPRPAQTTIFFVIHRDNLGGVNVRHTAAPHWHIWKKHVSHHRPSGKTLTTRIYAKVDYHSVTVIDCHDRTLMSWMLIYNTVKTNEVLPRTLQKSSTETATSRAALERYQQRQWQCTNWQASASTSNFSCQSYRLFWFFEFLFNRIPAFEDEG